MLKLAHLLAAVALGCAKTPHPSPQPPPEAPTSPPAQVSNAVPSAATPPAPLDAGGPVADAEQVIARLRPAFKSCYNRGLTEDPSMAGRIVVVVQVAPSGDVVNVTKDSGSGLSADVESCIMKKTAHATFSAGPGGTLKVPVTFVMSPPRPVDGG